MFSCEQHKNNLQELFILIIKTNKFEKVLSKKQFLKLEDGSIMQFIETTWKSFCLIWVIWVDTFPSFSCQIRQSWNNLIWYLERFILNKKSYVYSCSFQAGVDREECRQEQVKNSTGITRIRNAITIVETALLWVV